MTTPPDTPQRVLDKLQQEWLFGRGLPSDRGRVAEQVLDALTAAGYRIIQTDQAEHGDQLLSIDLEHAYATLSNDDYVKYVYGDYQHASYDGRWEPSGYEHSLFALRRVVGNEQDTP
jgi:hypothetical protein